MRPKSLFLAVVLIAAIVGGLYFAQSRGLLAPKKKRVAATRPTEPVATPPPATPAPATPAPVAKATPPPEPAKPAGPTPEQVLQSRLEAAQAAGSVRAQMARADFAGAVRLLEEWLATNGTHLQAAAIQGQAERLRAAAAAVSAMLAKPAALVGQKLQVGDATWTITGVEGGRLKCQAKSQFGAVERPIEAATLVPAQVVPLLRAADAAGGSALTATFLLGVGYVAEARAAIPAPAPQKDALLAGVAEWERLAQDHAATVALDGVGTLVARGDFAAAKARLEQARKLFGTHDFFTTAYAAKVADWTARIASAPAATPSPTASALAAASTPMPGASTLPPGPALPAGALDAARAALLEGVSSVLRIGQPGPVVVYGAAAFPVLMIGDEKGVDIVAAAALAGKGRALIFGHNGYIGKDVQSDGDLGQLIANAVKWCGGREKPRIGVRGARVDEFLNGQGFRAEKIAGPLKKSVFNDFDVVMLDVGKLTDADEATALKDYLEGGGGVIAAMTGWAMKDFGTGTDFYTGIRANEALAAAGIAFTNERVYRTGANLAAQREPAPMLNAHSVLAALQKRLGAAPAPTLAQLTARSTPPSAAAAPEPAAADFELGGKTLGLALEAMPAASKAQFFPALAGLVSGGKPIVPTKAAPLTESLDADARLQAGVQARLLKLLPPSAVTAHPAAEDFPGRVAAGAKPVTRTVRIDPAIPAWHSTGLYADAGAPITVKLPPDAVAAGYAVRIGCHTDSLYHKEQWPRFPEITRQTALTAAETVAASAFGGLVYIVVPGSAKGAKPFETTISGAFEAPLFVLGETTDAQWKEMLKRPAPWAELACSDLIVSVPAEVAREVKNPTEVMQYWQRSMDAHHELSGVAAARITPERMVPDVAIGGGFMHSGYPIMLHLPEAREMVTVSRERTPGWGFHHEIGHNLQKNEWTFEGTGEVTNNLFAVYVTEVIDGKKRGENHGGIKPETQAKKWGRYRAMGAPYTEWKGDPFLALGTFLPIIDEFGWDPLKKFFRSYDDPNTGAKPKTDEEERDQWLVRYSKIVGKNLGPYFDACGIPVSSSAKAEVSSLPAWMPPGFK